MKSIMSNKDDESIGKIDQQSLMEFHDGVMQAAIVAVTVVAALVGIWGLMSLFGGIVMGGGVAEMARGWLGAIGVI